jgi:hypothetical protein
MGKRPKQPKCRILKILRGAAAVFGLFVGVEKGFGVGTQNLWNSWAVALQSEFATATTNRVPSTLIHLYLSRQFPESRLQNLLSRFSEQIQNVGFRHFGDEADFNHGHILFAENLTPVAILYHTQEHAFDWSRKDPGGIYDYIDRQGRNWIQWLADEPDLDGLRIENAMNYLREGAAPNENYTIYSFQLDPQRVGYSLIENVEFKFSPLDCGEEFPKFYSSLGKLSFVNAGGVEHCYRATVDTPSLIRPH